MQLNKDRQRKEYVVFSEILPDEINSYCSSFQYEVVESVNGQEIWSLDDLSAAFQKSADGHCLIRFMGKSNPLVLDYSQASERNSGIRQKYGVPAEKAEEDKL